jgi:hypothetical protein
MPDGLDQHTRYCTGQGAELIFSGNFRRAFALVFATGSALDASVGDVSLVSGNHRQNQEEGATDPMQQNQRNFLQDGAPRHNSQGRGRGQRQGGAQPDRSRHVHAAQGNDGELRLVTEFSHGQQDEGGEEDAMPTLLLDFFIVIVRFGTQGMDAKGMAKRMATVALTTYSGNQLAMATPKTTASVFSTAKAASAPSMTGIGRCREARVMQTS